MKVARMDTLRADAGWRMFSYLKITTDDGIIGWSEFTESFDNAGLADSLKIAAMAEVYEMNRAPHNFFGHLCTIISGHFSANIPNFRVMEIDIDSCPWRDEFYHAVPEFENGGLKFSTCSGWSMNIKEAAVRAPPK